MKIAVLNADYPAFLQHLYSRVPELAHASYDRQLTTRNASLFGVADYYSENLRSLGHEALDLHVNNSHLQSAWAREHGIVPRPSDRLSMLTEGFKDALTGHPRGAIRTLARPFWESHTWLLRVLTDQLDEMKPDVILNQAMDWVPTDFLAEVGAKTSLLLGQIAAPLPEDHDLGPYDLLLSSLPNFVDRFREAGKPAVLHRLGFEPRVLEAVPDEGADVPVSFVGSLSPAHGSRIELLEAISRRVPLEVWGNLHPGIPASSPLRSRYRGSAWGIDMYRVLRRSKVTINHHIDIAGPFANNMRLYEATGVGAALVTDDKINLDEIFEVGREVVTYTDASTCIGVIEELIDDDHARQRLAAAGQQRTLAEHTYAHRAAELIEIIEGFPAGM